LGMGGDRKKAVKRQAVVELRKGENEKKRKKDKQRRWKESEETDKKTRGGKGEGI